MEGFTIKCNKCGEETKIETEHDITMSPIYAAGYDGEIGIECGKCKNKVTQYD